MESTKNGANDFKYFGIFFCSIILLINMYGLQGKEFTIKGIIVACIINLTVAVSFRYLLRKDLTWLQFIPYMLFALLVPVFIIFVIN